MNNVNITGTGIINSVAGNTNEFYDALCHMKCGIKNLSDSNLFFAPMVDIDFESCLSRYKEINNQKYELTRKLFHRMPKEMQNTVLAVWEAVSMSGIPDIEDRRRISVIIAGSNLFANNSSEIYKKYAGREVFTNPRYAVQFMDTYIMSLISEIFDVKGEGFTVGGASASGNVAIVKAKQLIDLSVADACIIVGTPTALSAFELYSFENLGALGRKNKHISPYDVCRPFDVKHDGFVPAQAAIKSRD